MRLFKVLTVEGQRLWAVRASSCTNNLLDLPSAFTPLAPKSAALLESGSGFNSTDLHLDASQEIRAENVGKILAPLPDRGPAQIYACGLNYASHAAEAGLHPGRYPTIILKANSSVCGHGDEVYIPRVASEKPEVDYEAELAVVIGQPCLNVSADDAGGFIAGFTVANDITARRWQGRKGGSQWGRSKSFDTFTPIGPCLVGSKALGKSPGALDIELTLTRDDVTTVMQASNTNDMINGVNELVAFLSQDTTLLPWTVLLTGTPQGVGYVRKPPVFLQPGDEMSVTIEGIGTLSNRVCKAKS